MSLLSSSLNLSVSHFQLIIETFFLKQTGNHFLLYGELNRYTCVGKTDIFGLNSVILFLAALLRYKLHITYSHT